MASKQIGHNEIDMLHGPLFMKILLFALPLAASSVLQQLFMWRWWDGSQAAKRWRRWGATRL